MDIKEFIEVIKPAFGASGDVLTPETRFEDLSDWNSLAALMIFQIAGQQLNVSLEITDLLNSQTVKDLYDVVISKQ